MTRWQVAAVGGAAILSGIGGGALVERFRAPRIVTVTEYRDRVVEHTVTVEKPVVEYRDRVIVRTVTRPDGTKVETHVDEKSGKTTGEVTTTTDTDARREVVTRVDQRPEGRWSFRALASVDSRGGVGAGGGFDYRLVGPLTVGAYGTAPVAGGAPFVVGVSLGLRLP